MSEIVSTVNPWIPVIGTLGGAIIEVLLLALLLRGGMPRQLKLKKLRIESVKR